VCSGFILGGIVSVIDCALACSKPSDASAARHGSRAAAADDAPQHKASGIEEEAARRDAMMRCLLARDPSMLSQVEQGVDPEVLLALTAADGDGGGNDPAEAIVRGTQVAASEPAPATAAHAPEPSPEAEGRVRAPQPRAEESEGGGERGDTTAAPQPAPTT